MKKINLKIPVGYEILEKTQTLKTNKALDLLLSGKQAEFSKATNRYDGHITLFYSVMKCPYCGNEMPLKSSKSKALCRDEIVGWICGQLNLVEAENKELIINSNLVAEETFDCPCCQKTSKKTQKYYDVTISKKRGKIKVSCLFSDIKEIINTGWAETLELKAPFVYYETTVFNLHNGHTYIGITNQEGKAVKTRDITEKPDSLKNGVLYNLLKISQNLRKELKKFFRTGNSFKFHSKTMTFEDLVIATRFIGFNKEFYKTIPFYIGTYKIFPGFESVSKKLHIAQKIPALYERLKLPQNKATRRIVFADPGLLFYYSEIIKLYNAINNIDYFNRILSQKHIYFILAKINCYPIICEFIEEAFRYESKSVVIKELENSFYSFSVYAIRYMAMSEVSKKIERKREKWLRECIEYADMENAFALPSVVRVMPCERIIDCEIGGYNFEWLLTSGDYEKAGRELNNCLLTIYLPTIVVKLNGEYIAALSIDTEYKGILEAAMRDNRSIKNSISLCEAIRKWCQKYDIEWEGPEVYDF